MHAPSFKESNSICWRTILDSSSLICCSSKRLDASALRSQQKCRFPSCSRICDAAKFNLNFVQLVCFLRGSQLCRCISLCFIMMSLIKPLLLHLHRSFFNSSLPSAAYMRQWIGSALVQIMLVACSAPSHYLNHWWVIVNWTLRNKLQWSFNIKIQIYSFTRMHLKTSSVKWRPFCPGWDELITPERSICIWLLNFI